MRLPLPPGLSFDDIAWDTAALRTLMVEMLQSNGASAADLIRAWHAPRGLLRKELVARMHESFFRTAPIDLWEGELHQLAHATFDELLATTRGENFRQRIGILQLEAWLGMRTGVVRIGGWRDGMVHAGASALSDEQDGERREERREMCWLHNP